MRHIKKGAEPAALTEWKALANENWNPSAWEDLQNPYKSRLLHALIQEQGYLCCYCEARIMGNGDSHIEHVRSRKAVPYLMFDYTNLLASCDLKLDPETREKEPRHCGHAKDHDDLPVHPLMPDCRTYFEFSSLGEISPVGQGAEAAGRAIGVLKLDLPALNARRRRAIDGIIDALDSMSDADLRFMMAGLDKPDGQGRLLPFGSAVLQVLERYSTRAPLASTQDGGSESSNES